MRQLENNGRVNKNQLLGGVRQTEGQKRAEWGEMSMSWTAPQKFLPVMPS